MPRQDDGSYEFLAPGAGGRVVFKPSDHPAVFSISLELPKGGCNAAGAAFIRECIDFMFNETPALILTGLIHRENRASRQIAALCHWTANPLRDVGEYVYRSITIGRWLSVRGPVGLEKANARRPSK